MGIVAIAVVGGVWWRVACVPYLAEEQKAVDTSRQKALPLRHQIYGDPAIMEAFERGEFTSVLPREGNQLLAIIVQPGKLMCAKGMNPRSLRFLA